MPSKKNIDTHREDSKDTPIIQQYKTATQKAFAAGFDGGAPKRVSVPSINAATLSGNADPIASNDPLAVALDVPTVSISTSNSQRKRITFEDLVSEDDIDIPDFMK